MHVCFVCVVSIAAVLFLRGGELDFVSVLEIALDPWNRFPAQFTVLRADAHITMPSSFPATIPFWFYYLLYDAVRCTYAAVQRQ
jgi:hypothetical protein